MQISFEKVLLQEGCSFSVTDKSAPRFDGKYHVHPEIEITLITAGTGTRLVGDSINRFGPGDLVILGENLPHQYTSHSDDSAALHEAKIIQFKEAFLGEAFIGAPELSNIRGLLERAKCGLKVEAPTLDESKILIGEIIATNGLQRLLALLKLLDQLARTKEVQPIASGVFESTLSTKESQKIDQALLFMRERLDQPITLEDLSKHLSNSIPTCNRLLNKSLRKTFKALLIEMRVSNACRQLADTDASIIDIALASGFHNLSNFNRQFKALKACTPSAYRKRRRNL